MYFVLLFSVCSARPLEHKAKSVKSLTRANSNKRPIRIRMEFIIVNKVVLFDSMQLLPLIEQLEVLLPVKLIYKLQNKRLAQFQRTLVMITKRTTFSKMEHHRTMTVMGALICEGGGHFLITTFHIAIHRAKRKSFSEPTTVSTLQTLPQ